MTHLNIQQGLNIEVVSTNLIKKLYEAALSVPEPLEGELDAAYMSGNLLVDKSYRTYVSYLTGRFPDLHINVTDSYYIPFEDSAVLNVLLANNIGSDGIGVMEAEAANATLTDSTFLGNTDITSFNTFKYFTKANNNPPGSLFKGCTNLTSIDLSNVTTCSNSEFRNSGLSGEISLPNLTGNVPRWSFAGTKITSVTNLGTVTGISSDAGGGGYLDGAFTFCNNLVSVTIPSTVTAISGAFLGCSKLTTINGDLTNVITLGNSSFSGTKISSLPNTPNVLTIGNTCFSSCTSMTGVLNYPNLTSIGREAFKETAVTSILDLGSITSIPLACFNSCTALTSVTIPSTVTLIGKEAFLNCTNLVINTLDLSNMISIGARAFSKVGVKSVIWSSTLTEIPTGTFQISGLENISNIDHVTKIKGRCFLGCNLKQVLYLKNVVTTSYYGNDVNGSDNGNTFTADNVKGLAYGLYMPKTVDVYGGKYPNDIYASGFFGARGLTIIPVVYFRDLEELYPASFSSLTCQSLIINNITPPVWYNSLKMQDSEVVDLSQFQKNKVFPANCNIINIYVPDSAVSTYTNDPDWSTLISRGINILSMNNLTHYNTEADWITAGKPATGIIDAYM